ncbi:ParB/RepB/Spo0J family partition protein [Streptomyces sp. Ncost-T10-10d]|uniref:ParB/RepB/Spo0J family partition protein n=1 Tax=Streptomyces sp. Ncost-T10-10d TaxID=1839774 RepID=UPI00081EEBEE|nr:ParB/RepB/Spo0J family partition protein [Streptomyces sp. Ncost-T10-10d]SCF64898.1 chromosome partitioning protein, ParB family [Streptomyces sp. Ncost-T10-10d]
MSKADQLGNGRFGGSARPVSARRTAIGVATGVPTAGVAPPTRLPVVRISPNPENPRTNLGDLTDLVGSLKEHGQKQAVTVMNRDAYVKANPSRSGDLEPDTTHVVVDGSSRLAAAREAGLTHLNVMVDDEQGSDGDAILESALVANIHRNDLDPLDEAHALQRLLALHGSQVKLAKRLSKSQGWVSQRIALLNLTPELQAVVGQEPVELLRSVAKAPQERQQAVLQELKEERARKEAERRTPPPVVPSERPAPEDAPLSAPSSIVEDQGPEGDAVTQPAATVPPTRAPQREARGSSSRGDEAKSLTRTGAGTALDEPAQAAVAERAETVPDPRAAGGEVPDVAHTDQGKPESRTTRQLPYDDGAFIAMHLIQEMSATEFDRMLSILNKHQSERGGTRTSAH